jgi:MFS superfamily sulfate permease-like transporter
VDTIKQLLILRFAPFLTWIGDLRDKRVLRADMIAGLTVALVLIPQSMAYAQLAGLPAYYGLYASFLPPIVGALFGSSRQLATGPVAVVSLMTAAALQPIAAAGSAGYVAYAVMLALMVGVFQMSLGLLRLGVLVNFLSHPVVLGFTNAAAIIIATSQLDKIFGVRAAKAEHHYETVWNTIVAATHYIHLPTFGFAVLAFSIMIGLKRYYPRLPGVLIAVVLTTAISWGIKFEKKAEVPTDRIVSEVVQEVIADQVRLVKEIDTLQQEINIAQTKYDEAMAASGIDDSRTMELQHALDTLKLKIDRRSKSLTADLEELTSRHFVHVPAEDGGRFYLKGGEPKGMEVDDDAWRLRTVKLDGSLVMAGGGKVVGAIPEGLPSMKMPEIKLDVLLQLMTAAMTISLLGFMEAISIAKAMAAKTRQRLDPNQELIGQGMANVLGSLFQSYPTSGSFSRSAVNIGAGAVTGFSSVVTGVVVIIALLFLTPLLYHLPQATLAAVIMMAVIGLVNVAPIKHAWKVHRHDGIVAIVSFLLTLAFAPHLDKGIMVGVGLSLILYLYRSMVPRVVVLARHTDGTLRDAELFGLKLCPNISVIRFDGSLYFANTSYFEDKVLERVALKPELRYVIVAGEGINEIDATSEEMLSVLVDRLHKSDIEVLFANLKRQVFDALVRTGFVEHVGRERFFRRNSQALHYAWEKLGDNHEADCPLNIVCPIEPPAAAKADRASA